MERYCPRHIEPLGSGILPRPALGRCGAAVVGLIDALQLMEIPMTRSKTKAAAKRTSRNTGASGRVTAKRRANRPSSASSKLVKSSLLKVSNSGRANSKQAQVLAMLQSPDGTTIDAIVKATEWQQHSVRGFLAGIVRKKLKLNLISEHRDNVRVYRIAQDDAAQSDR
jgi:hypothetical protein